MGIDGLMSLASHDQPVFTSVLEDSQTFRGFPINVGTAVKAQLHVQPSTVCDVSDVSGFGNLPLIMASEIASFRTTFAAPRTGDESDSERLHKLAVDAVVNGAFLDAFAAALSWKALPTMTEKKPLCRNSWLVFHQLQLASEMGIVPAYLKMDDEPALWRAARLWLHELHVKSYALSLRAVYASVCGALKGVEPQPTVSKQHIQTAEAFLRTSQLAGIHVAGDSCAAVAFKFPDSSIMKTLFKAEFVDFISAYAVQTTPLPIIILSMICFDLHRISNIVGDGSRTTPLGPFREFVDDVRSRWQVAIRPDSPFGEYLRRITVVSVILCHFHVRQAWSRELNELVKELSPGKTASISGPAAARTATDRETDWLLENGIEGAHIRMGCPLRCPVMRLLLMCRFRIVYPTA